MAETAVLVAFFAAMIACVISGHSVLWALTFGFVLFFCYGLARNNRFTDVLRMAARGVCSVKCVLIMLTIIGVLGAYWRASGTISYLVYHALAFVSPTTVLLAVFLLCAAVSAMLGTAFGTAGTVGVVCITLTNGMGISPALAGGAILAGIYVGDRWSPLSTSACLVASLTHTRVYENLRAMIPSTVVPLLLSGVFFVVAGSTLNVQGDVDALRLELTDGFVFHPALTLPMVVLFICVAARLPFYVTMLASAATAAACAFGLQGASPTELARVAVFGFAPLAETGAGAQLVAGGGVISMVNAFAIVCISSTYAGIFDGTGLLNGLRHLFKRLAQAATPFVGVLAASAVSSIVSCNQTLAILVTQQLCKDFPRMNTDAGANGEVSRALGRSDENSTVTQQTRRAIELENSVVPMAALVPWSIACTAPLSLIVAPVSSLAFACFLYLLPLCELASEQIRKVRKARKVRTVRSTSSVRSACAVRTARTARTHGRLARIAFPLTWR